MGSIKKLLSKTILPPREDHHSRMFIDLAENIHIHHREYRQIFNLNEFFEYCDILKQSELDVRNYLTNNMNYKEHEYPTTLLIAGGKERQLKFLSNSPSPNQSFYMNNDMAIELQEEFVTDEIHMHYRDFRLAIDRKTFRKFADTVKEAKDQLDKYELNNKYVRKSHSDRVIKDFNSQKIKSLNKNIMGTTKVDCKMVKSFHYEDLLKEWKPNQSLIKKIIKSIQRGDVLPPIILSKKENGYYYLIDGHHRLFAHLQNGEKQIDCLITNLKFEETEEIRKAINLLTEFDRNNNFEFYISDFFKSYIAFKLNKFYKDDYSNKIKKNTLIYRILRKIKYSFLGKASHFKNFLEKHNK